MKVGDTVSWVNGVGIVLTGMVVSAPAYPGDRPWVRESRNGTLLRPRNAVVIEKHARNY